MWGQKKRRKNIQKRKTKKGKKEKKEKKQERKERKEKKKERKVRNQKGKKEIISIKHIRLMAILQSRTKKNEYFYEMIFQFVRYSELCNVSISPASIILKPYKM